jgi:hypothetical protein
MRVQSPLRMRVLALATTVTRPQSTTNQGLLTRVRQALEPRAAERCRFPIWTEALTPETPEMPALMAGYRRTPVRPQSSILAGVRSPIQARTRAPNKGLCATCVSQRLPVCASAWTAHDTRPGVYSHTRWPEVC